MSHLCDYGCENAALHTLKNGKYCCHQSPNQCPAIRVKNSNATKKSNKFVVNAANIKVDCKWCNKTYSKSGIKSHEKACYLNPDNLKICPVCGLAIKDYRYNATCSSKCARKHFDEKYKTYGRNNRWDLTYRTICFDHHEKKCIICGEDIIVSVHHYDGDHKNDDPRNLVPMCPTHHNYMHSNHLYILKECVDEYVSEFKRKFKRSEL